MVDRVGIRTDIKITNAPFSENATLEPVSEQRDTFTYSIYSSPNNTVFSTSSNISPNSVFGQTQQFDFSLPVFSEAPKAQKKQKAKQPSDKCPIPPQKKSTKTQKTKRNTELEEYKKFTQELKKLLDEYKAELAKGKKGDTKSIIIKIAAAIPYIQPKQEKIISQKVNKNGTKEIVREGTAPDGTKTTLTRSYDKNGELLCETRVYFLDGGKVELIQYTEDKNDTKDNDPSTKRSYGTNIKYTDEKGEIHALGVSQVYDKRTGKLEIVNIDENNEFGRYSRTRFYYDEKGNFDGRDEECGNLGGIGIRVTIDRNGKKHAPVVTSNIHYGKAQTIPLSTFNDMTRINTDVFTIDFLGQYIGDIKKKGEITSQKELTDKITTDAKGVTHKPVTTTYELKEKLSDGKYKIDYVTITEIHSSYTGFGGVQKKYGSPELDTVQHGVKYVSTTNGTEVVIEEASTTYQGDPVNGIIIEQTSVKGEEYTYINEAGKKTSSQLLLTVKNSFENNEEQGATVTTCIPGVIQRTQYIDAVNPDNTTDIIEFLQDGSQTDLNSALFYLGLK